MCIAVQDLFKVINSEYLLARLTEVNEKRKREERMKDMTNVTSPFPSLSAESTGSAVRKQVRKSKIKWEDVDHCIYI